MNIDSLNIAQPVIKKAYITASETIKPGIQKYIYNFSDIDAVYNSDYRTFSAKKALKYLRKYNYNPLFYEGVFKGEITYRIPNLFETPIKIFDPEKDKITNFGKTMGKNDIAGLMAFLTNCIRPIYNSPDSWKTVIKKNAEGKIVAQTFCKETGFKTQQVTMRYGFFDKLRHPLLDRIMKVAGDKGIEVFY